MSSAVSFGFVMLASLQSALARCCKLSFEINGSPASGGGRHSSIRTGSKSTWTAWRRWQRSRSSPGRCSCASCPSILSSCPSGFLASSGLSCLGCPFSSRFAVCLCLESSIARCCRCFGRQSLAISSGGPAGTLVFRGLSCTDDLFCTASSCRRSFVLPLRSELR